MKFTLGWLKEHLDTEATVSEIAERLTALGLEVEGVEDPTPALAPFVVGHVLEAGPHPDADRLKLCRVTDGQETLQIVCGAPNARTGLKVALARIGAVIPATGDRLKKGKIRGIESQGMMCSSRELGLGDDHAGILELPEHAPVGAPLVSVLAVDPVIDIAITPNRADALGVRGIARDLAASGLGRLKPETWTAPEGSFDSPIGVAIAPDTQASGACAMFVGRLVRGVRNGESPPWLKDRLTAIGLRPISALVDITNYVSYDRARPLHVFDADRLVGGIEARFARAGETLLALDEATHRLDPSMVVIADQAAARAIGGVMGGLDSGCTDDTVTVFVESAYFSPERTAATGRALGIDSDARYRFERGVDPEGCGEGADLAVRLILDLCGGEASRPVVAGAPPDWRRTISLRPDRVRRLGGVDIPVAEMTRMLTGLGCTVASDPADANANAGAGAGTGTGAGETLLRVDPPSWRVDLHAEHDLIEEVIRLHGFDAVPAVPLPRAPMPRPVLTPAQRRTGWVRRCLAGRGLLEAVTWSFMPQSWANRFGGGAPSLRLANPISSDLDAMRPSILPNLMAAAGRNAARGFGDVGLFEIGPCFSGGEPGDQSLVAAGLRAGQRIGRHWAQPGRSVDVFDAKADALAALEAAGAPVANLLVTADAPDWYHPGRSGCLRLGPKVLATFGDMHPLVLEMLDLRGPMVGFEVVLDAIPLPKARPTRARPPLTLSPFQPVTRDFAFVVTDNVAAQDVVRAARGADKGLITDAWIFDVYQGERLGPGRVSMALAITVQPTDHTLTDEEIEAVSAKVVAAVSAATGATLRG